MQYQKRRPLSRYLKDFKHTQTHCAHCRKELDRITLARDGEIVSKIAVARLNAAMSDAEWQIERPHWRALCRFCGDLYCKTRSGYFDIIGFRQYLNEQTDMSPGTVREYVVRLRRLSDYLESQNISLPALSARLDEALAPWLPPTSTNNYRIALRKYARYLHPDAVAQSRRVNASAELY